MRKALILTLAITATLIAGCNNHAEDKCIADGGKVEARQTGVSIIGGKPYPVIKKVCVINGKEKDL
jgi:uncharacterized lipoprotein NlpE involved in copper resistance